MGKRCLGCMEIYGDEFNICPHCGYVAGTSTEEPIHMSPGTILHDRYIIGKVLGFGGFGVTYIAWDGKLEQKVAIKEYLPSEFSTRMPGEATVTVFNGEKSQQFDAGLHKFIDEAKRLAKFQNEPGIVKIFDSFEDNRTAYIVMEYLDGETLGAYLKREGPIPEDQAVDMIRPIMESLITVHAEGLIHRDIAPDNIFLTKTGETKLIDFGASRYATTTHSRSLTVIVKPGYSPEEQYRSRSDQGPHTDVYAVAATLYKMITGKTPPDAMERRAKYENQNKDILVEPHKLTKNVSVNREIAILNGLNVRIEDRTPDITTLLEELYADPPAKRRYGKIRKIDVFSWPLWMKVTIPTVMALLITFGVLILTGVISFSKYSREVVIPDNIVIAPDVEGMANDEAIVIIEEAKLLAVVNGSVGSEYIPAGNIIMQRPVGGSFMEVNGVILLTISSGNEVAAPVDGIATIPFIKGDTREAVIEKCKLAGLGEPVFEEVEDEYMLSGLVISSEYECGEKVPEGTVLHIKISKGSAPFAMPQMVGLEEGAARVKLEESGLMVQVEYEYSASVEEGKVIRQSVPDGTDVQRGAKITIVVSSGGRLVVVDNVVGRTQEEAIKTLEKQGFAVYVRENTDETVPAGSVISQSPDGSSSQKEGSTITIFVSTGKKDINVTLDDTEGEGVEGSRIVHINELYGDLPTPTRTGYHFDGWFTSKDGGVQIKADSVVIQPNAHALYAHWTPNQYTVLFDSNGGSASNSSRTVTFDSDYGELPTLSRTGYSFDGWFNSSGTPINANTKVQTPSDHTLSAHWTANTYTVSLNANGGSVSSSSKKITYDSEYGDFPEASREGYSFNGWFTDLDGGSQITSSTTVTSTSDHTLYAHWSINTYDITFDATGGSASTGSKSIVFGDAYGELPTASRTGYSFDGWFTDVSGGSQISASTTMNRASDHSVYAHWTANIYTLSFDVNGGTGSPEARQIAFDSGYGELPTTSRDYYDFAGWYTAADGGSEVSSDTLMSGDTVLYAHWNIHPASDWVLVGDVPEGAMVVEEKWTYVLREYSEVRSDETSDDKSGWTLYDTQRTDWGPKQGPYDTDPSDGVGNVTTEKYEISRTHHYKYYHRYGQGTHVQTGKTGYVCGSDKSLPGGKRHEIDLTKKLSKKSKITAYGVDYQLYGSYTCPKCGTKDSWFVDGEYDDIKYGTHWYYQDPIYTDYYYRDLNKEASEDPSGQENVSDVTKYVKYRVK